MEEIPWVIQFHEDSRSTRPEISTYADLLRVEKAKFATRHLAENYVEACKRCSLNFRQEVHQQTFFLAQLDAEFYHIPDGYIISARPLFKVDFKRVKHSQNGPKNPAHFFNYATMETYCIWHQKADHYDYQLWDIFNYQMKQYGGQSRDIGPERVKRIYKRGEVEPEGTRIFSEGAIEPEEINLRPHASYHSPLTSILDFVRPEDRSARSVK